MKKGIVFLIIGIIILIVSLILLTVSLKNQSIFLYFLFFGGVLLAILGSYAACVLGIDEIFKSIRKERLRKEGWDINNSQEDITKGQFIIHKIDPNGIEGKPTVIKSIIVDKNFIFIGDYP